MFRNILLIMLLLIGSNMIFAQSQEQKQTATSIRRLSIDGPYVFHLPDGKLRVVSVGGEGQLIDTVYNAVSSDFTLTVTPHRYGHPFQVRLQEPERPACRFEPAGKILVLSDPHGDWQSFLSILLSQGVIDEAYDWIFGANQLVVIGDVFDRGEDVTAIFWLLYKLEQEARRAGGEALFLLGNHEEMELRGNERYAQTKYKWLADTLHTSYRLLYGEETELGRWLRTRNLLTQIGDYLFVHAGLDAEFLQREESFEEMNETVSRYLSVDRKKRAKESPLAGYLFNTKKGPFWYRGMVYSESKYEPIAPKTVEKMRKQFKVKRIFVGHTIFPDVTPFFGGRVIAVNVQNETNRLEGRSRGVLIHKGKQLYLVYDEKPSVRFK